MNNTKKLNDINAAYGRLLSRCKTEGGLVRESLSATGGKMALSQRFVAACSPAERVVIQAVRALAVLRTAGIDVVTLAAAADAAAASEVAADAAAASEAPPPRRKARVGA